jgi:hypothetical protein
MVSNVVDSPASVFSGICPQCLASMSQDLALLRYGLQQWWLLCLQLLHLGWLSAMTSDESVSQLLTGDSGCFRLTHLSRWPSWYSLAMDPLENTAVSSVAWRSHHCGPHIKHISQRCLHRLCCMAWCITLSRHCLLCYNLVTDISSD